jgi:hypothetical protein
LARTLGSIKDTDGKVRTDHPTDITLGALRVITDIDRMVPLAINLRRFKENVLWAKLNTEATPLTPLRYDNYLFNLWLHITFAPYLPQDIPQGFFNRGTITRNLSICLPPATNLGLVYLSPPVENMLQ